MAHIYNPNQCGLVFGAMFGGVHLVWSLLIALGLAQPLMDFIFVLHRIKPVYVVMPFSFAHAIGLVIVTGLLGYVIGYVSTIIWNKLQK